MLKKYLCIIQAAYELLMNTAIHDQRRNSRRAERGLIGREIGRERNVQVNFSQGRSAGNRTNSVPEMNEVLHKHIKCHL